MSLPHLEGSQLTPQDLQNIQQHISAIQSIIQNRVIDLNAEDRRKYGSVNELNKLFINKVSDVLNRYPHLMPSVISKQVFETDYEFRGLFEQNIDQLQVVTYIMESGKIAYDHNNYKASLTVYNYLSFLANNTNDTIARQAYEELKTFFPRNRQTDDTDTTNTTV